MMMYISFLGESTTENKSGAGFQWSARALSLCIDYLLSWTPNSEALNLRG